jgi:hypothetical protein
MRASAERRRVAALIAVKTRDGADAGELAQLRRQLDQLRVRETYLWSLQVMTELPSHDEVSAAASRAGRALRSTGRVSGDAA